MSLRPLLKHKRDHHALFNENARLRDATIDSLGLTGYSFNKTPKFISEKGARLTIEPERSIVIPHFKVMQGVIPLLEKHIQGFHFIRDSEAGFRYPTAALAGMEAPFIKRMRSEYFHKVDEDRSICRPVNLSYGIKSRGKADNRLEYEVWVPDSEINQNPLPLMIEKYGEDLPQSIRDFVLQPAQVYGWMGVKRAAFEALYQPPSSLGDMVLCLSFSLDAYNIGAKPDLSYAPEVESSIALSQAEFEWEVIGYYKPKGSSVNQDAIWKAITFALEGISEPLEEQFATQIIPSNHSKTERILAVIDSLGSTQADIEKMNLQPQEFMHTSSFNRVKSQDPSRSVNFLGRLNRLFYQPEHILPSLHELHNVMM